MVFPSSNGRFVTSPTSVASERSGALAGPIASLRRSADGIAASTRWITSRRPALSRVAFLRIRFTPNKAYAAAPNPGESQTSPTHAIVLRVSRFVRRACSEAILFKARSVVATMCGHISSHSRHVESNKTVIPSHHPCCSYERVYSRAGGCRELFCYYIFEMFRFPRSMKSFPLWF